MWVRTALLVLLAASLSASAGVDRLEEAGVGLDNPHAPTPATLYLHVNGIQDFPINTQAPAEGYHQSEPFGMATHSTSCLPAAAGVRLTNQAFHTYYGYSSPGYVEYAGAEGTPRVRHESGMAGDVLLATTAPAEVSWYLETQAAGGAAHEEFPAPVPRVHARATLRTGNVLDVAHDGFDAGDLVARGEVGPLHLDPTGLAPGPAAARHEVDGRSVYELRVPLEYQLDRIPSQEGFNLRIDVSTDARPACPGPGDDGDGDGYVMPNAVRVHTSPGLRPRVDLAVLNPIQIDYVHPRFEDGVLRIRTQFTSPWGGYDVDESAGGTRVAIVGPTPVTSVVRERFQDPASSPLASRLPVQATYAWDYERDGARDGVYLVRVSAWNDQRTAQANGTAAFDVGQRLGLADNRALVQPLGGNPATPGPALPAAALALLAALALARRRPPGERIDHAA